MKVMVIGSGGREHALCWKIAQSGVVDKLYAAPGNGGISQIAQCIDIRPDDITSLLDFSKREAIDLTVVGPEAPLAGGIVDYFKEAGLKIFGPDRYAAQLEASKAFAKEKMAEFGITTADFKVFGNADEAKGYIKEKKTPLVIKADGLAAGKGVIVAHNEDEALSAVDSIMLGKRFGPSGDKVVVEDCLAGEEASIILVADGKDFVVLASSQDHKRIFDNDKGPNTGGMGAYSPAPVVTEALQRQIDNNIIRPLFKGFTGEGISYRGVLYIGLMITKDGPYVLEFNVRFGDPETQAILPRLKTDLVDIIEASIEGSIKDIRLEWDRRPCVSVVCASGGYPGDYKKGLAVSGLDEAGEMEDVIVFHAGTRQGAGAEGNAVYETNGGRVLGVTALGGGMKEAAAKAYAACSVISFEGMHYRRDIARRAINRVVV